MANKSFDVTVNKVHEALVNFYNAKKSNTFICLCCDKKQYAFYASTSGKNSPEQNFKHIEKLMNVLTTNTEMFDYFNSIMVPVQRYYKRQARLKTANKERNS